MRCKVCNSSVPWFWSPDGPKQNGPCKVCAGRRDCAHCGTPLRAIGRQRSNGVKHHDDWSNRQYHKKCFKLLKRQGRI